MEDLEEIPAVGPSVCSTVNRVVPCRRCPCHSSVPAVVAAVVGRILVVSRAAAPCLELPEAAEEVASLLDAYGWRRGGGVAVHLRCGRARQDQRRREGETERSELSSDEAGHGLA